MRLDVEVKAQVELVQVELPERGFELERLLCLQALAQVVDSSGRLALREAREPLVEQVADAGESLVVDTIEELVRRLGRALYARLVARAFGEERLSDVYR